MPASKKPEDLHHGEWPDPFGRLSRMVGRELRQHVKANTTMGSVRDPFLGRRLRQILSARVGWYFALYAAVVVAALGVQYVIQTSFPGAVPSSWTPVRSLQEIEIEKVETLLKDLTSYLLGAQATLVGLVFPVAVGLVTMFADRHDTVQTDIRVYYSESLAYEVGASSLCLAIALTVQLVWPAQYVLDNLFGFDGGHIPSKGMLTVAHGIWLVINLLAIWHFLHTSLSFIQPADRGILRRLHLVRWGIPADIEQKLESYFVTMLAPTLMPDLVEEGATITAGMGDLERGSVVVSRTFRKRVEVVDIWTGPLCCVIRRWWGRRLSVASAGHGGAPSLILPLQIGSVVSGRVDICLQQGGARLCWWERRVIACCYRFRRAQ